MSLTATLSVLRPVQFNWYSTVFKVAARPQKSLFHALLLCMAWASLTSQAAPPIATPPNGNAVASTISTSTPTPIINTANNKPNPLNPITSADFSNTSSKTSPSTSSPSESSKKDSDRLTFLLVGSEKTLLITAPSDFKVLPTIFEISFKNRSQLDTWKAHQLKQANPLFSSYFIRTTSFDISKPLQEMPKELNGDLYFGRTDTRGELLTANVELAITNTIAPPSELEIINAPNEGLYYRGITDGRYWYLIYQPHQPTGIPFTQILTAEADTSVNQQPEPTRWWTGRIAHRETPESRLQPGFTGVLDLIGGPPLFFRILTEPFFLLHR